MVQHIDIFCNFAAFSERHQAISLKIRYLQNIRQIDETIKNSEKYYQPFK